MTADEIVSTPAAGGIERPLSILIADDEAMIRRALRRLFERRGHAVHEADSATAALKILKDVPLDAVLVDSNMPGDGSTVLQALSDSEDFQGVCVLMTGALVSELDDLPPGTERLQKPFDFDVVVELVEGPGNRLL